MGTKNSGRHRPLSKTTISKTLDSFAEGNGTRKAAKDAGIAPGTAWKILQDFPLWKWCNKTKNKGKN